MLTFTQGFVLNGEVSNSRSSGDESSTGTSSSDESLCKEIVEVEGSDEELVLASRCLIVNTNV